MAKKIFHHSPHRAVDSMKILVGNKTNATIRDFEETEEDVEEITGVVVSIDKDKITGNGWEVKDDEGNIYYCNIAFSLYELPETREYGGMYYPTSKVTVKFTRNPVLRTNTITEVTSLGEDETKIDLSKWKHGDKPTTIIGKAKSAISISDNFITFNYDNTNVIKADANSLKMEGDQTDINTNNLNINSDVYINGDPLDSYLYRKTTDALDDLNARKGNGVGVTQNNGLSQLNIIKTMYIPAVEQRIIFDLMDPRYFPAQMQVHPLLTGSDINRLYIYPNGLVSVQSSNQIPVSKADITSTINWLTPQYSKKNVLTVTVASVCSCCDDLSGGVREYFNYCPHCKTWNTLYENQSTIRCSACSTVWCPNCGHDKNIECGNTTYDLKVYGGTNRISGMTTHCDYCKDKIPTGLSRVYANYCPECHKWGYLVIEDKIVNNEERRVLQCTYPGCGASYCLNCSISQGTEFNLHFLNDSTLLDQKNFWTVDKFNNNYKKLTHIRDE